MRTAIAVLAILAAGVLMTSPVYAEEPVQAADSSQLAKVYRDYPGYMAPVQCEGSNAGQAPVANDGTPSNFAPSASICRERAGSFYVGAWAGITDTEDAEPGSDIEISFDNGYGGGLAVGYDFGTTRLELEGSYRKSDIDKVKVGSQSVDVNEDLEVFTVLVNGYVDFATDSLATPYLGVGAGYARAEVEDGNDDFWAAQLAAGLLLELSPAVSVDLGYRYLLPIDKDDLDIHQHTAFAGLQFRF